MVDAPICETRKILEHRGENGTAEKHNAQLSREVIGC